MIRSTKCSLKFANTNKRNDLSVFIDEYRRVCQLFVNEFWGYHNVPKLAPKKITERIKTWLSARALQCAAKQASGIVRGTKKKQADRIWRYNKLLEEGDSENAKRLLKVIDKHKNSKPSCDTVNPELDSRFVKTDCDNETSFDIWLTIGSLGNKLKIKLPVRKTKHFNKLQESGSLKTGVRLSKNKVVFMFEMSEPAKKTKGESIGIDMGVSDVFCTSSGISSKPDNHGHTLKSILSKMCRKQKGSKAFRKAEEHRTNYINWSINQLNMKNISEIRIENLKNVRKGKRSSRMLSHWTYTEIKDKIIARCEENGVRLALRPYAYSSQRCSKCGWTQKANRLGKRFCCKHCSYTADADINAAVNLSLDLPKVTYVELRQRKNLDGFFYVEQEPIVPVSQKQ